MPSEAVDVDVGQFVGMSPPHPWLALRRQGHPWPLPPLAVGAKAEVWLDRHASRSKKSNGERLDSGHKKHPDRIP
jgi:hypothetical protein